LIFSFDYLRGVISIDWGGELLRAFIGKLSLTSSKTLALVKCSFFGFSILLISAEDNMTVLLSEILYPIVLGCGLALHKKLEVLASVPS
jgi:hypothetical protein